MMGKRRRSSPFRQDFEPGQVGEEVRRKKRVCPLTKGLKHTSIATVLFDCLGVPFPGDNTDTSLQFSKTVPREIGRHNSSNEEPFSPSFEAAKICETPLSEKLDSALNIQKSTKIQRRRRGSRKRGKGGRCEQRMLNSSLQPQSDFGSNHSSATQMPSTEKDKHCLNNAASDDSKNVCILSEVYLDTPTCSDMGPHGKKINMARKQKNRQCLKNEVSEKGLLDNKMDCPFVAVERSLRSPLRKKLLILDLNGILCDVVPGSHCSCLPHKKVRMRSVFKRPFLDDFLAFCFERFVVGVWSSRNKINITGVINYVMGDSKDRLLFCWDQSKCTFTGFNTIENKHKPLVLKELIKLWDKEEASLPWEKGEYSPSNTLLVDDSPYKALYNPVHTAIFPFPYDFQDEGDSALGPGGAVRVYLESIAMADDVQAHVMKHPFGQKAISSRHEMWSFYENIINQNNSTSLTR